MSKTFRRAAMSSICMLIVAVMSLTGATYAWFTAGENAVVKGMNVTVSTAEGGVQVRGETDEGVWSTVWQNELDLNVNAESIKPVSSADAVNFFNIDQVNPLNANQYTVKVETKANNNNIIVKKFQLSNPGATEIDVNLVGTTIQDAIENSEKPIYKAARIALIVTGGGNDITYYLGAEAGDPWNGFTAVTGTNEYATLGTTGYAMETDDFADCVITLPGNPDNKDLTDAKLVTIELVMWLEGQDAECTNANASGAFKASLNFQKIVEDSN